MWQLLPIFIWEAKSEVEKGYKLLYISVFQLRHDKYKGKMR